LTKLPPPKTGSNLRLVAGHKLRLLRFSENKIDLFADWLAARAVDQMHSLAGEALHDIIARIVAGLGRREQAMLNQLASIRTTELGKPCPVTTVSV
jgi:hypothetical protein